MIRQNFSAIPGRILSAMRNWVRGAAGRLAAWMRTRKERAAGSAPNRNRTALRAGTIMLATAIILSVSVTGLAPELLTPSDGAPVTEAAQDDEDPDPSQPAVTGLDKPEPRPELSPADTSESDTTSTYLVRGETVTASGEALNEELEPEPTPEPTKAPEPTPTPIQYPTTYTVRSGDSIWGISETMYAAPDYVNLISHANGLSFYNPVIYAGQVLEIPDPSTPVPAPTPPPAAAPAAAAPAAPASSEQGYAGYSAADVDMFLKIVASEAGAGWSYDGALMIAQVIVNRVHDGRWGGLRGVLTAQRQFTPYSTGVYRGAVATATERQAALDALNGATVFSRDVLYFCTDAAYARSSWFQSLPIAGRYANTIFFHG